MGKLLSFAIPCYNSAEYMEHCINTVLAGGDEVEVIIVDDGSTKDNTYEIAKRYEKEYPDIVKAVHQENGGHGEAVNTGLKHATGRFFKVVDSDDWIDHDMYQYLYTLMQEHDADVSACTYLLEQEGRPSKIINNTGKLYVFSRKEIIRALVKNDLVKNYLWAKLFKRKLFDRLSFPVGRVYEDVAVLYLSLIHI